MRNCRIRKVCDCSEGFYSQQCTMCCAGFTCFCALETLSSVSPVASIEPESHLTHLLHLSLISPTLFTCNPSIPCTEEHAAGATRSKLCNITGKAPCKITSLKRHGRCTYCCKQHPRHGPPSTSSMYCCARLSSAAACASSRVATSGCRASCICPMMMAPGRNHR
jgi:hypothetical protein